MPCDQLHIVRAEIAKVEKRLVVWQRNNDVSRRLATIRENRPITASAIAATVPDAKLFRPGRQFAAWLGLTPRTHSSGGKKRLVGISRQGDGYIRCLPFVGATRHPVCAPRLPTRSGLPGCSSASRPGWCRSRSPTRPREPPGQYSNRLDTWLHPTAQRHRRFLSCTEGAVHKWTRIGE